MRVENDLRNDPIRPLVLRIAIPSMLAQFVSVLYSVVDRMYLGRLPGHLALTGLGLTIPIISIIMGFANLCGMLAHQILCTRQPLSIT